MQDHGQPALTILVSTSHMGLIMTMLLLSLVAHAQCPNAGAFGCPRDSYSAVHYVNMLASNLLLMMIEEWRICIG